MTETNENDPNVPLVDGVLANEGVVDNSHDERQSGDVKGAGEESIADRTADLADPSVSNASGED